jgi:hypothetical protein
MKFNRITIAIFLCCFLFSCKTTTKIKEKRDVEELKTNDTAEAIKTAIAKDIKYNDTVKFPWRTEEESGYFKGYITEKLNGLEKSGNSDFDNFISNNLDKKEIVLINKETLSHSVSINQKTKIRIDTYKNENLNIVSTYYFGDYESQKITFNGKTVRNYKWSGVDTKQEDIFLLDEKSFRYFSFRGNKYYYFDATIPHTGGSVDNICYFLIYNLKGENVSAFYSCRYEGPLLFGNVNGDDQLDFLNFRNEDFCTTVPGSDKATFELYSCNTKGEFVKQKDKNNKPYFIEGNTGIGYNQDSFKIKSFNWPVKVK